MLPVHYLMQRAPRELEELRHAAGVWHFQDLVYRMTPDPQPFGLQRLVVRKLTPLTGAAWQFYAVGAVTPIVSCKWHTAYDWMQVLAKADSRAYFALLAAALAVEPLTSDDVAMLDATMPVKTFDSGPAPLDSAHLMYAHREVCPFLDYERGVSLVDRGAEILAERAFAQRERERRREEDERRVREVAERRARDIASESARVQQIREADERRLRARAVAATVREIVEVSQALPEPRVFSASTRRKIRLPGRGGDET